MCAKCIETAHTSNITLQYRINEQLSLSVVFDHFDKLLAYIVRVFFVSCPAATELSEGVRVSFLICAKGVFDQGPCILEFPNLYMGRF